MWWATKRLLWMTLSGQRWSRTVNRYQLGTSNSLSQSEAIKTYKRNWLGHTIWGLSWFEVFNSNSKFSEFNEYIKRKPAKEIFETKSSESINLLSPSEKFDLLIFWPVLQLFLEAAIKKKYLALRIASDGPFLSN